MEQTALPSQGRLFMDGELEARSTVLSRRAVDLAAQRHPQN